jgi:hypothetical protein
MTITSEQLKKAFAPITQIAKAEPPVAVDLEKIATLVITEASEFANAEDPIGKLDALYSRVDKIDAMLEGATVDERGNVLVKASDLATAFTTSKPKQAETAKEETTTAKEETSPEVETDASTQKASDSNDLSNDISWENDLSPTHPPVLKSERMTKDERVVPAQQGGRASTHKAADAREKALARRDERKSGVGRSLS